MFESHPVGIVVQMSLIHPITSIEGVDRERVASSEEPAKPVWRELNYDAFPLPPAQAKDQPVDVAYEVSTAKRIGKYFPSHSSTRNH